MEVKVDRGSDAQPALAEQIWRQHAAYQVGGAVVCIRCPGRPSWPCPPVHAVLPVLNRTGLPD